jgi:hypothetical protein
MQHPGHGAEGCRACLLESAPAVELPEQLVRAVDQVDDQ